LSDLYQAAQKAAKANGGFCYMRRGKAANQIRVVFSQSFPPITLKLDESDTVDTVRNKVIGLFDEYG